jgi:hypothetical protein
MKELVHCRAMESLYRQGAALHPEDSWKLLAEAEKWRHRALDQVASHFEECNASQQPTVSQAPPWSRKSNARDGRQLLEHFGSAK